MYKFLRRLLLSVVLGVLLLVTRPVLAQEIGPLPTPELSGKWVANAIYVLLLVLIEFVPEFSSWWDRFEHKRSAVAGLGVAFVIGLIGLNYAGAFGLGLPPFGWDVVGLAINALLDFLGGGWLIWSMLEGAGALPRKRKHDAIEAMILGRE